MVSPAETGDLAEDSIADALAAQGVTRNQLTLHGRPGPHR